MQRCFWALQLPPLTSLYEMPYKAAPHVITDVSTAGKVPCAGNFCVGRGAKTADVYLVDYGFAKFYNPQTAVPRVRR